MNQNGRKRHSVDFRDVHRCHRYYQEYLAGFSAWDNGIWFGPAAVCPYLHYQYIDWINSTSIRDVPADGEIQLLQGDIAETGMLSVSGSIAM